MIFAILPFLLLPATKIVATAIISATVGYAVGVNRTKKTAKDHMDPDRHEDFEEACNKDVAAGIADAVGKGTAAAIRTTK